MPGNPKKSASSAEPLSASKIELAKALKAVKGVLPSETYQRVRAIVAPPELQAEADRAVEGLTEEDEFALLCRLMGTTTHLVPLEQRPIIRGDFIVPDFLARFQPGCYIRNFLPSDSAGLHCFVEVKSTKDPTFSIGGGGLRRLREFADTFGFPLFFAVRFLEFKHNALWVVVEDADRNASKLEVEINHLIKGVRHVLWDEYWFMLLPSTYFQATFIRDAMQAGVTHSQYGTQVEFHIADEDRRLRFTGLDSMMYAAFFEPFGLAEYRKKVEGDVTYVTCKPEIAFCSIADMVYRMNRLPRDEAGRIIFDASRVLAQLDQDKPPSLITRQVVEAIANRLFAEKLLYTVGCGDPEAHVAAWRRYGGKK